MFCTKCGFNNEPEAFNCGSCGESFELTQEQLDQPEQSIDRSIVPEDIKGFNFGAFALTWIWAFSGRMRILGCISLVVLFLPSVNLLFLLIVMIPFKIFMGIKGSGLAWKAGDFQSVQRFKDIQRVWTSWGIIEFCLWPPFVFLAAMYIPSCVPARDTAKYVSCLDALSSIKVAEEMYVIDNKKYTGKSRYLVMYMTATCTDPAGAGAGCVASNGMNYVDARVANFCSQNWKLEATKEKFLVTGVARDRNTCHICIGESGYRPNKYADCYNFRDKFHKECSDL